jgi:hypothetical protein
MSRAFTASDPVRRARPAVTALRKSHYFFEPRRRRFRLIAAESLGHRFLVGGQGAGGQHVAVPVFLGLPILPAFPGV